MTHSHHKNQIIYMNTLNKQEGRIEKLDGFRLLLNPALKQEEAEIFCKGPGCKAE